MIKVSYLFLIFFTISKCISFSQNIDNANNVTINKHEIQELSSKLNVKITSQIIIAHSKFKQNSISDTQPLPEGKQKWINLKFGIYWEINHPPQKPYFYDIKVLSGSKNKNIIEFKLFAEFINAYKKSDAIYELIEYISICDAPQTNSKKLTKGKELYRLAPDSSGHSSITFPDSKL